MTDIGLKMGDLDHPPRSEAIGQRDRGELLPDRRDRAFDRADRRHDLHRRAWAGRINLRLQALLKSDRVDDRPLFKSRRWMDVPPGLVDGLRMNVQAAEGLGIGSGAETRRW